MLLIAKVWFYCGRSHCDDNVFLCSYNGGRTAEDIIQFINGKANTGGKNKKPLSSVVDLDASNFDSIALDASRDVLVEFYAPCECVLVCMLEEGGGA